MEIGDRDELEWRDGGRRNRELRYLGLELRDEMIGFLGFSYMRSFEQMKVGGKFERNDFRKGPLSS